MVIALLDGGASKRGPVEPLSVHRGGEGNYPVTLLCRVLQVAASGYYARQHRGPSRRSQAKMRSASGKTWSTLTSSCVWANAPTSSAAVFMAHMRRMSLS